MHYDPFQTYSAFGGYPGATNPFQTPYTSLQSSLFNPAAAWNPQAAGQVFGQQGYPGIPNYGGQQQQNPFQQQQNPLLIAAQQLAAQQQMIAQQIAAQQLAQQVAAQQGGFGLGGPQMGWQQAPFNPQINPMLNPQFNPQFNPMLNPQAGLYQHHGHQGHFGLGGGQQQLSPFGQYGFPLAPQSWVGQPNPGIQSQFGPRSLYSQGITPGFQG
jgi:hypothetical protein